MRSPTTLLIASSILLTAGCDPAYRIRRDNMLLHDVVSIDCLKSAIEAVAGTQIVSDHIYERTIACQKGMNVYEIEYVEDGKRVLMVSCFDGKILKSFSQLQTGIIGNTGPERMTKTLTKLREVEKSIEKRCSVEELSAGMKDDCRFAPCGD